VANTRQTAAARKTPAPRREVSQAPQPRTADTIAIVAMAMSIAAAGVLVDPRAEAAFEAPKRFAALLAIVVATLAVLALPRLVLFGLLAPLGASRCLEGGRSRLLLAVFLAVSAINGVASIL
jgi:hypothetical protein